MTTEPGETESDPAFDWGDALEPENSSAMPVDASEASTGIANPGLLAIFGGLYAVWSVAWVLGIAATPTQPASSLLDAIMFQFGEFLAMVASPLWFGVVWWLTTESKVLVRVTWMVVGLVLLTPLALILPVVLR